MQEQVGKQQVVRWLGKKMVLVDAQEGYVIYTLGRLYDLDVRLCKQ